MFDGGLADEVRRLCELGRGEALKHLRPLGYMETLEHLEDNISLEEAIRLTKQNSRRYAKRQMTWFRKEDVRWISLAPTDSASEAAEKIISFLPDDLLGRLRNSKI